MNIKAEIITFAISLAFAIIGLFDYLVFVKPHYLPWIASFISLLATVGILIIERAIDGVIDKEMLNDLGDLEEVLRDK